MKMVSWLKQQLAIFWQDQRGVYMIMVGLLSFVLLAITALAVDGSGLLLDKARLGDSMEQATMALAAENNLNRNDEHRLDENYATKGERLVKDAFFFNNSKVHRRDQELIKGYIRAYMPNVKFFQDFDYDCTFRQLKDDKGNIINTPIVCWANGEVKRPSWLFLNDVKTTFAKEERISSSGIAAIKQASVIPLDVMVVADLSTSMNWITTERRTPYYHREESKLTILKSVMSEISDILLDTNPAKASPYNRLGFVSFAVGAQQLGDTGNCVIPFYGRNGETSDQSSNAIVTRIRNGDIGGFLNYFPRYIDYDKTINSIRSFDGKQKRYPLHYPKGRWCLSNNRQHNTTQAWFGVKDKAVLKSEFSRLSAFGATLVSSGTLIGANLVMDKNTNVNIDEIKENTQRILLILSDGQDEMTGENTLGENNYRNITKKLIEKGMCTEIRNQMNSLQDPRFRVRPSRIAFVVFGYTQSADQEAAWKHCVGATNYYRADNKTELLNVFKQIIGFEEEVGRPTFQF
ncbi:TadE/TadG family type IV pilus assembly protein [Testudinibacter sp. P80/BLE/0925]|uniref:TadE/TadG family type IV pilus assembly protein n=1 Tax=Testudinibacter sp. TW-1 TaxID=3417757 RepID=UPI003D36E509